MQFNILLPLPWMRLLVFFSQNDFSWRRSERAKDIQWKHISVKENLFWPFLFYFLIIHITFIIQRLKSFSEMLLIIFLRKENPQFQLLTKQERARCKFPAFLLAQILQGPCGMVVICVNNSQNVQWLARDNSTGQVSSSGTSFRCRPAAPTSIILLLSAGQERNSPSALPPTAGGGSILPVVISPCSCLYTDKILNSCL